jgi:hypothetical protein
MENLVLINKLLENSQIGDLVLCSFPGYYSANLFEIIENERFQIIASSYIDKPGTWNIKTVLRPSMKGFGNY